MIDPAWLFFARISHAFRKAFCITATQNSIATKIVIGRQKKYDGIKKINLYVAKDGKIILKDEKLIEENYPQEYVRHIQQLNVLDIKTQDSETWLEGPFVTKRTKKYKELTGRINIKRVNLLSQSD